MSAYIIFTRVQTLDQDALEHYWSLIRETMKGHPIEVLVPYGNFEVLEGPMIEGIVVAKFPDMAKAKKWYESDAYQNAAIYRQQGAIYHGILVEGI